MSVLQKMITRRDNKQTLAGKSLTEHLCRKHGAVKEVVTALMLNENWKDDNPTARQRITMYTKSLSREATDNRELDKKISELQNLWATGFQYLDFPTHL